MWIPEFLMVYKMAGGHERGGGGPGGGVMSRVGNDRVHGNLTGGGRPRGKSPVGKRRGENARGGTA